MTSNTPVSNTTNITINGLRNLFNYLNSEEEPLLNESDTPTQENIEPIVDTHENIDNTIEPGIISNNSITETIITTRSYIEPVDIVIDTPEDEQTPFERKLYNFYANNPDEHIVLEPEDHKNIYKYAIYTLANTDEHDDAVYDIGISPSFLRDYIQNCQRIQDKEYFTQTHSKIDMRKWLDSKAIEHIPEYIPDDCIRYYTMTTLLLDSSISPYSHESSLTDYVKLPNNMQWQPIRAVYNNPVDNILYSAVFLVPVYYLDYIFDPNSPGVDKIIGITMPEYNPHNDRFTTIINNVCFQPLTHLYIGIDDLFSIGKHFGYIRVIGACERAKWHGLYS